MHWISACFVLHNICVEVEGSDWVEHYAQEEAGSTVQGFAELVDVDEDSARAMDEVQIGGTEGNSLSKLTLATISKNIHKINSDCSNTYKRHLLKNRLQVRSGKLRMRNR